jgi:hypothetical protein
VTTIYVAAVDLGLNGTAIIGAWSEEPAPGALDAAWESFRRVPGCGGIEVRPVELDAPALDWDHS